MDKTEGKLVAQEYNIAFYPTLLFITPEGTLIKKEVGYKDKNQLLEIARSVLN